MTTRDQAYQLGLTRYTMDRPCRRGHLAERYTSCGICCTCADENQIKANEKRKQGRAIANAMKFEPGRVYTVSLAAQHHALLDAVSRICERGTSEQIDNCKAMLDMMSAQVIAEPTPHNETGIITNDDVMRIINFDTVRYMNGAELDQDWDASDILHIKISGRWYIASEIQAMRLGQRAAIKGKLTL